MARDTKHSGTFQQWECGSLREGTEKTRRERIRAQKKKLTVARQASKREAAACVTAAAGELAIAVAQNGAKSKMARNAKRREWSPRWRHSSFHFQKCKTSLSNSNFRFFF